LDIGSGPGLLAYDMASTVGPEGRVCGFDFSEPMLAISRKRCAQQDWVEFDLEDVGKLPYADHSFDAAVSTQVYEYVHDIGGALTELFRVLRPGLGRPS
jgi:ubiquinone/menaquinone biosynthesis C-methylase UbiE